MSEKVNLAEKLATFTEHWAPRTVTEFNGHDVMGVKVQGPFVWQKHDDTDDFIPVLAGEIDIEMPDRTITLGPGEVFVLPQDVDHRPVAEEVAQIMIIEPTGTPNTGDAATAAKRRRV